jgi:hypothetical protein
VTSVPEEAIVLWDLERRRRLHTVHRFESYEGSTALAFSAAGQRVAFACNAPEIERWQEGAGRLRPLTGHSAPVVACAFLGEHQLASASLDHTLKIWDLATGECVHTVYGPASFRSIAASENLIVAGDELGNTWMLEPRPADPARILPVGEVKARHALLFGVDSYERAELEALPEATHDVQKLAAVLLDAGYAQAQVIHGGTERPPTLSRVRAALRSLTLDPDELLLVHFSCHGTRIGGHPYLFMADTENPPTRQDALAVAEILELMAASRARRRVLLVDACNAGLELGSDGKALPRKPKTPGAPPSAPEAPPPSPARRSPPATPSVDRYVHLLGEGTVTIFGSTAAQETQQDGAYGAFTRTVIEAFEGARKRRRALSVTALAHHVTSAVRSGSRVGIAQDPTVTSELLGDFLVASS